MSNLIIKTFDYKLVDKEQEMKLRIISERIRVRVQRTAEEMLSMGSDLIEAKAVCKEDGKLFSAWCESDECPVGYRTAVRLMSVNRELGGNAPRGIFDNGFKVLSEVTQTREEDIKQALLEHIEAEADKGEKVTQKEINLLKKSLKESKVKIDSQEDEIFDAQETLKRIVTDRDTLKDRNKKLLDNANTEYKKLQELESSIKDKQAEIDGLDEEFEADLKVREKEIREEVAKEPLTHKEVEKKEKQLKEIEDEKSKIQVSINLKKKELLDVQREFKESKLREKALNEFNKGALNYRENVLLLISGCNEMKNIPMTSDMHESISLLINTTNQALESLKNVISIKDI